MEEILEKLGFSEYKKKAYIALIELETGTVGNIARKSKIPSSKIYEILEWLYNQGYISIIKQKPLTYKANNPKHLLKAEVKSRMDSLKKIEEDINKITTSLGVAQRNTFQIVYGRDAFFKKVKESVSRSEKSIIAIVKSWRVDYDLKEITTHFIKRGGKVRFLGPTHTDNRQYIHAWKSIGIDVKNHEPESTRFTVWDGKIITIGFKDDGNKDYASLWIENEYLGKILTDYFEKLWKSKTH